MSSRKSIIAAALLGTAAALSACSNQGASPASAPLDHDGLVALGKYLVSVISCTDCHTPGKFTRPPGNEGPFLSGSDAGFEMRGVGTFYGPNLTPDDETGLGTWSEEEIASAITTGARPDGRVLAPVMPYASFANLTAEDARAIAAYLKSLPPVSHKVLGPYGPSETPEGPFFRVMMPEAPATE